MLKYFELKKNQNHENFTTHYTTKNKNSLQTEVYKELKGRDVNLMVKSSNSLLEDLKNLFELKSIIGI